MLVSLLEQWPTFRNCVEFQYRLSQALLNSIDTLVLVDASICVAGSVHSN